VFLKSGHKECDLRIWHEGQPKICKNGIEEKETAAEDSSMTKRIVLVFFLMVGLSNPLFSQLKKAAPKLPPGKTASTPPPVAPVQEAIQVFPFSIDELLKTQAVFKTSLGEFVIEFYADKAPEHCRLFATLVKNGFFEKTTFHQMLLGGFVMGGDPQTKDPEKKALYGTGGLNQLKAEFNDTHHVRGTVSAALAQGDPNSAGSQFFVCVTDQPQLDGKHTAWGHVVEGMDVIDKISSTPTDSNMMAKERVEIFQAALRPIPPPQPIPFADATREQMRKCHVILETSMGNIEIEFFPDSAPEHVRNFLKLSKAGLYDTTIWHRVVPGFVIQGGELATGSTPIKPEVKNRLVRNLMVEISERKHERGSVSMARADELDSATTSFFICLADLLTLDGKYTVFGRVVNGMEVVDKIAAVPVDNEKPRMRVDLIHAQVVENPSPSESSH